jgi:hypothetical protein
MRKIDTHTKKMLLIYRIIYTIKVLPKQNKKKKKHDKKIIK